MPSGPRSKAKQAGLARYVIEAPCPAGHVAERYVSTGGCVECLLQKARLWKEENRERTRTYARGRYWQDPESHIQRSRQWHKDNPERSRALHRSNRLCSPEAHRASEALRRARKANSAGKHTAADILALAKSQRHRCAWCRHSIRRKFHVDHIVPLALGGSNGRENIQLLCPPCNQRKSYKDPIQFAQENGRLL